MSDGGGNVDGSVAGEWRGTSTFRQRTFPLIAIGISILGFLIVIEVALRHFLHVLPVGLHRYLYAEVSFLAQSSKRDHVPEDYIAIFGDSYAAGAGDWHLNVAYSMGEGNRDYHSADLIFASTGTDVASFGLPGAGNYEGFAYHPLFHLVRLDWRGIPVEPPEKVLAYFYEGNDPVDNTRLLERYHSDRGSARSESDIRGFLHSLHTRQVAAIEDTVAWYKRAYVPKFLKVMWTDVQRMVERLTAPPLEPPAAGNVALVDGAEVELPPGLQSPALELDPSELEQGLTVTAASLELLRSIWPDTPIHVVYLPSVLSSYEVVSDEIVVETLDGLSVDATPRLYARSDIICEEVARAANAEGFYFLDARPFVQAAAQEQLIHGPRDWKHFNRPGYEVLADAALLALERPEHLNGVCRSLH